MRSSDPVTAATVADPPATGGPAPGSDSSESGATLPPNGADMQAPPPPDPAAALTRAKYGRGRPGRDDPRFRGGGKKSARKADNFDPDQVPQGEQPGRTIALVGPKVDYRATAVLTVHTVVGVLSQVLGAEWGTNEAEDTALCDATEAYFRAKNIPDIPPGWMLAICVCGYALPRLNHDNTRRKIGILKGKVMGAFKRGQG